MAADVVRRVREEEEALLGRCRAFVLGGPDTPGGGLTDVVYLTPDGRWLRICSLALLDGDADPDAVEGMALMDPSAVGNLFDSYYHPRPAELPENRARDNEVRVDAGGSLEGECVVMPWVFITHDSKLIGGVGPAGSPCPPQFVRQLSSQKSIPRDHLYLEDFWTEGSGVEIRPRNSLLALLRQWAIAWPPPPRELAASLTLAQSKVLWTLHKEGLRFSKSKLESKLVEHGYGLSTTGMMVAIEQLGRLELVDNVRAGRGTSKGYGLTRLGIEVANNLPEPKSD